MTGAPDPAARIALPARRECRTHKTVFEGKRFHVTAGFHAPAPGVTPVAMECFINGSGKVGSERDLLCDDAAVMISLLLQLGMRPRTIRRHLGLDPLRPGEPLSIIAAAVDAVIKLDDAFVAEWKAAHPPAEAAQ